MELQRLKDDLDLEDFRGLQLSYLSNSEFLNSTKLALFQRIQSNTKLQGIFLTKGKDRSIILYPKAIDIYKLYTQDFLKHVLVLYYILPSLPLQEPELLSVIQRNIARQRYLLIQEKLVMIYTQYYKGQQQSRAYKDNIRFLPKVIRDLLLVYITYILLLYQIFL